MRSTEVDFDAACLIELNETLAVKLPLPGILTRTDVETSA